MRDDIHKSAPVNSKWRQYLKRCLRDADRGDRAFEAAADAVAADCRQEISPAVISAVLERFNTSQPDLFISNLEGFVGSADNGVLGQSFLDRVRLAEMNGPLSRAAIESALADAIAARVEDRARAMIGHILKNGGDGGQAAACIAAIKSNLKNVSAASYAKEICDAGDTVSAKNLKPASRGLSLDEKLN
jgi:hypothetical protein